MNDFQLVKSQTLDLTKTVVEDFLQIEASPTEREVKPARIKHLAAKAANGTLITFNWSIAVLDGKRYRMNGQHSGLMLNGLDGNFPAGLKVHIDEYAVNDRKDLANLFRQFDDRASGRSTEDVSGAYQGLVDPLVNVPRKLAKQAAEGIAWYKSQVEGQYVGAGDDIYALYNDASLHPFIIWIGDLLSKKTPEIGKPVIGAMFATFNANEKEARTFWEQVARGGPDYEDNAPSRILDKWLLEQLDGTHSPAELVGEAERRLGPSGPARLARLLADLGERGFLSGVAGTGSRAEAPGFWRRLLTPRVWSVGEPSARSRTNSNPSYGWRSPGSRCNW